jgi:hypothetical protein
MKNIILLLIGAFTISSLSAQDIETEKLKNRLQQHQKQDTIRIKLLNELSFSNVPVKEKEEYALEALDISKKQKYLAGEGFALSNLSAKNPGKVITIPQFNLRNRLTLLLKLQEVRN